MAIGDIISGLVQADGEHIELVIEGWGADVGAVTYTEKSNDHSAADSDLFVSVLAWGYTNSSLVTKTRSIEVLNVAKQLGSATVLDETNDGGNLRVVLALSEPIYQKESDGGAGTTGTNPTVTVQAGWANNGTASNAVADLEITNNSTLQYPRCLLTWDYHHMRGGMRRMTEDFELAASAYHQFGIDSVYCEAVGDTSAHTVSGNGAIGSTQSPTSLLYFEHYSISCPLSGFTQGEKMNCRFVAYPLIGDAGAVVDTDSTTDIDLRYSLRGKVWQYCDKDHTVNGDGHINGGMVQNLVAFVDIVNGTGSGTVGDVASAKANPFSGQGEAFNAGARVVYVIDSGQPLLTKGWGNSTGPDYHLEVKPDPENPAPYLYADTANDDNYRQPYYCIDGIGVRRTAGGNAFDGENGSRQLLFVNSPQDNQVSSSAGQGYRSKVCGFLNCSGMGGDNYNSFGSNRSAYIFWGCETTVGFGSNAAAICVANKANSTSLSFFEANTANPIAPYDQTLVMNNYSPNKTISGANQEFFRTGDNAAVNNAFVIGNIVAANVVTTSGPLIWIRADGSLQDCKNVHIWYNSIAGERFNCIYNDQGTAANVTENVTIKGNAFRSFNIKGSYFGTPSANRSGNRGLMGGCGVSDNIYDGSASINFTGDFEGVRTTYELAGGVNVYGELGYVDEGSADGTGLGDGDYTPDTGSVLIKGIGAKMTTFDLFGDTGTGAIGAVNLGGSPPSGSVFFGGGLSIGLSIGLDGMMMSGNGDIVQSFTNEFTEEFA